MIGFLYIEEPEKHSFTTNHSLLVQIEWFLPFPQTHWSPRMKAIILGSGVE